MSVYHLEPKNVAVIEVWPYIVERWPRNRDFSSSILNGDAVGIKVNGRYREGGRLSEVAIERGSTVAKSSLLKIAKLKCN